VSLHNEATKPQEIILELTLYVICQFYYVRYFWYIHTTNNVTLYENTYQTISSNINVNRSKLILRVRCLIDTHLGKIPSFCKILNLKHMGVFDQYFNLISAIASQAWHSEENSTTYYSRIVYIS
jgi:hypothetical protein